MCFSGCVAACYLCQCRGVYFFDSDGHGGHLLHVSGGRRGGGRRRVVPSQVRRTGTGIACHLTIEELEVGSEPAPTGGPGAGARDSEDPSQGAPAEVILENTRARARRGGTKAVECGPGTENLDDSEQG
jgi:hypothetical protein